MIIFPRFDPEITLRPISPDDEPFLCRLFATTREDLRQLSLNDEAQGIALVKMQFQIQHDAYQKQFKQADFDLVLSKGEPIGRFYVDRTEDGILVIDISLLPEFQNRGIGSALLQGVLAEAAQASRAVRLSVTRDNPAQRLYQRLGFVQIGESGFYYSLEWRPK